MQIFEFIVLKLENEHHMHQRIILFFLVDSIVRRSHKEKGRNSRQNASLDIIIMFTLLPNFSLLHFFAIVHCYDCFLCLILRYCLAWFIKCMIGASESIIN